MTRLGRRPSARRRAVRFRHRHSRARPAEHAGLADEPVVEQPVAGRVLRRVPEVGDHVHAAPFQLGRLRVLVLVDHVLRRRTRPSAAPPPAPSRSSRRWPGSAGRAVEHQLVVDDLVGHPRRHPPVGEPQPRDLPHQARLGELRPDARACRRSASAGSWVCSGMGRPPVRSRCHRRRRPGPRVARRRRRLTPPGRPQLHRDRYVHRITYPSGR